MDFIISAFLFFVGLGIGFFAGAMGIVQTLIVLFFGLPYAIGFRRRRILKSNRAIISYIFSLIILPVIFALVAWGVHSWLGIGTVGFWFGVGIVTIMGLGKIGPNPSNIQDFIESNKADIDEAALAQNMGQSSSVSGSPYQPNTQVIPPEFPSDDERFMHPAEKAKLKGRSLTENPTGLKGSLLDPIHAPLSERPSETEIIQGYRGIWQRRQIGASSSVSDYMIVCVYDSTSEAFRKASAERGEEITRGSLNSIALYVIDEYRENGAAEADAYLKELVQNYYQNGLQDRFKDPLFLRGYS